jgi:type 1 glutamine amidotransferase
MQHVSATIRESCLCRPSMFWRVATVYLLVSWVIVSPVIAKKTTDAPRIVFLVTDDPPNYRAVQTIPVFAKMLDEHYGCCCTVLQGEGSLGAMRFPGLETIQNADLLVIFLRRSALSDSQLAMIRAYLDHGKPLVGIRTANHAFAARGKIAEGHVKWDEFCSQVLGCGNYGYGPESLGVDVRPVAESVGHPILAGVEPLDWHGEGQLYLVKPVDRKAAVLLTGSAANNVERVAWTRTCGKSRVFYTSLGFPTHFKLPQFNRLLVNGVFWAMDRKAPKRQ